MATVPYDGSGSQVAPDSRVGDDYQRLDVNADQFGAAIGRGTQQLGQGVEQAVKFHDQVSVDDQVNKVMSAADTIRRGDPNGMQKDANGQPVLGPDGKPQPDLGYLGLKGQDALHARPQVQSSIDQTIAAARANLTSPEAQLQFDQQTRRMRSAWANEIGDHAERQAQTWGVGVQNSAADLARQQIAANPSDPEQWKHALSDLVRARVRQSQLTYGNDPTAAADAERKARAEGAVAQVEALLNRDPSQAKQVLEGNRAGLDPQVYDQLVSRLRPTLAGDQADEAIRRASGGQPVTGGPVQHNPPAGGLPTISDSEALAARNRLAAGTGTDADRALQATYVEQQNTPAGPQPAAASPASSGATPAAPASAANGLPQDGLTPPARGDGGPAPSASAGTVQQPAYQDWRGTLSKEDRIEFDRIALRDAGKNKVPLPQAQAALYQTIADRATARGAPLPGGQPPAQADQPVSAPTAAQPVPGQPTTAAVAPPVTSPRHPDFVSAQQLKAAEAAAQIRDRKPVLSDVDKAADAADYQLLQNYKTSHGIPRTTGIDIAKLPDDPPQAMRDTSSEPVPHPDTHVIPPHPHVGPTPAPVPTFARSAGALPTPTPGAPATPFFAQIGAPYGISGNYLARTKQIESGSGSGAHAVSSSGAAGPFQFIPSTARRYGLTDPSDMAKSADAAARLAADNRTALSRTLGRAPDDAELYLAHQQGSGGAAKLLANPNVRAGDLVGDSAIRSNGGDPNAPASAFTSLWHNKFNGIKSSTLPMFASGFGSGQPYFGGAPGPGSMPPLPSPAPLPDPSVYAPPAPSPMGQAPAAPALQPLAGVAPPPAPPTMGQVPPVPVADPAPQALPPMQPQQPQQPAQPSPQQAAPQQPLSPPVAYNADDPSSPLPDRGLALAHARAMAGGDPIQARLNIAEVNRRYEEQNRETYTERMELQQQLPDLNAAASAGVDGVTLPERDIRRLFPPAKAQQIIGEFHANAAVGGLMRGVQWASPDQLQTMQRDLSSGLGVYSDALRSHRGRATTGPGTTGAAEDGTDLGFFRRREIAAKQINAEIQRRTALLVGPEADPAAYVATNPAIRQAAASSPFESYATASLGMQSFLGVPEVQQHVLTRGQAADLAGRITAAQDPKAELQRQATAAGSAWPHVFKDAIALGRLPAGYQAVQVLDDPHDAALLSRTLASEKAGPDGKPARSIDDTVDTMAGAKGEATRIRDAVRFDPQVKQYAQSLQASGASADQLQGVINSVETLALAKRSAGEAGDSASAASAAVKSFFGRFEYMPNGNARVPSKNFDAVSANARATLDGLSLDHLAVPPRFGQPGQPEPREYVDTIKAAPTWITSPKSDAIWLVDYAGRVVRGRDGAPVAVPFNLPGPAPAADPSGNVVPGL